MKQQTPITAVILAGGQGSRMGGLDKGWVSLKGEPLVQHVIRAIEPQVDRLIINANRNLERYRELGFPVVSDSLVGFQGPLAGFLAAMTRIEAGEILTLPCDGPSIPRDLVERLASARRRERSDIAVAHDGKRLQPVYALLPVRLRQSLQDYLAGGDRKIDRWYAQHSVSHVDFSDTPETFININTPDDRERLEKGQSAA